MLVDDNVAETRACRSMLEVERSIDRTNETGRMISVGHGINGAKQPVYQPLPLPGESSGRRKGMFVYRMARLGSGYGCL